MRFFDRYMITTLFGFVIFDSENFWKRTIANILFSTFMAIMWTLVVRLMGPEKWDVKLTIKDKESK